MSECQCRHLRTRVLRPVVSSAPKYVLEYCIYRPLHTSLMYCSGKYKINYLWIWYKHYSIKNVRVLDRHSFVDLPVLPPRRSSRSAHSQRVTPIYVRIYKFYFPLHLHISYKNEFDLIECRLIGLGACVFLHKVRVGISEGLSGSMVDYGLIPLQTGDPYPIV